MATMIDRMPRGAKSASAGSEGRLPQASPSVAREGRLPKASPGRGAERGASSSTPQIGMGTGAALPGSQRSDDERSEAERSGGPGNADRGGPAGTVSGAPEAADPEVLDRPRRRRFTAKYKRRMLRQADACAHGEVAALLRREGLYSSHLTAWRKERELGVLEALAPKKRGRKSTQDPKLVAEIQHLKRENQRLTRRLRQAETVIDVQKKVSELLGIPLNTPETDENA